MIDSAALANLFALVELGFARIDICVTNSAAPPSNLYMSTAPEAWRAADQLLRSTIRSAKKISPRIQKRDWEGLSAFTSSALLQSVNDGLVRSFL
jgi:hypothetical protein